MDSFLEHNSKQASQAEPTIEEIKNWDEDELLKWIQQRHPKLLKGDDLKKLKGERVDGVVFLNHAGGNEYFRKECNLASGTSERLANLASEIAGGGRLNYNRAIKRSHKSPLWIRTVSSNDSFYVVSPIYIIDIARHSSSGGAQRMAYSTHKVRVKTNPLKDFEYHTNTI